MKDTIKNSIIGAFAIFGLVALISSSNTAPTVTQNSNNNAGRFQISTEYQPNGKNLIEIIFDTQSGKVIQRRRLNTYDWGEL